MRLAGWLESRRLCPALPGKGGRKACMFQAVLLKLGLIAGPHSVSNIRGDGGPDRNACQETGNLGLGGIMLW